MRNKNHWPLLSVVYVRIVFLMTWLYIIVEMLLFLGCYVLDRKKKERNVIYVMFIVLMLFRIIMHIFIMPIPLNINAVNTLFQFNTLFFKSYYQIKKNRSLVFYKSSIHLNKKFKGDIRIMTSRYASCTLRTIKA